MLAAWRSGLNWPQPILYATFIGDRAIHFFLFSFFLPNTKCLKHTKVKKFKVDIMYITFEVFRWILGLGYLKNISLNYSQTFKIKQLKTNSRPILQEIKLLSCIGVKFSV